MGQRRKITERRFGSRLMALRVSRGWTLDAAAERIGISKTYLWEMEHDDDGEKSPSMKVGKMLASAYEVDLNYIAGID